MARGVRDLSRVEVGVGITGIAGRAAAHPRNQLAPCVSPWSGQPRASECCVSRAGATWFERCRPTPRSIWSGGCCWKIESSRVQSSEFQLKSFSSVQSCSLRTAKSEARETVCCRRCWRRRSRRSRSRRQPDERSGRGRQRAAAGDLGRANRCTISLSAFWVRLPSPMSSIC